MKARLLFTGLIILSLLSAGCTRTVVSASWKNPNFKSKILSYLMKTPFNPPEIRVDTLTRILGTAKPPGHAMYFGVH